MHAFRVGNKLLNYLRQEFSYRPEEVVFLGSLPSNTHVMGIPKELKLGTLKTYQNGTLKYS